MSTNNAVVERGRGWGVNEFPSSNMPNKSTQLLSKEMIQLRNIDIFTISRFKSLDLLFNDFYNTSQSRLFNLSQNKNLNER